MMRTPSSSAAAWSSAAFGKWLMIPPPKLRSVSSRARRICSTSHGTPPTVVPPIIPRPPAFATAAASVAGASPPPIGALRIGCSMPNRSQRRGRGGTLRAPSPGLAARRSEREAIQADGSVCERVLDAAVHGAVERDRHVVDVAEPALRLDRDVGVVAVVVQEAVRVRDDDGVVDRPEVRVRHVADRVVAGVEVGEEL